MSRTRLSQDNVVAVYPDLEAARAGVVALGRAGIEADKVSLLGRLAEEAAADPDTRMRDLRVSGDVAKGAGIGAAAGSLLGLLAGAAAFTLPGVGPVIGAGLWSSAAAGAAAGGAVGGMVGGVASVDLSEDWELTYQSVRDGKALVAVHADSHAEGNAAADILLGTHPERIARVDARGRRTDVR